MADSAQARRGRAETRIFLLTCWQERDEVAGTAVWRFKLELPQTGQRHIFTSLEEVVFMVKQALVEELRGILSEDKDDTEVSNEGSQLV